MVIAVGDFGCVGRRLCRVVEEEGILGVRVPRVWVRKGHQSSSRRFLGARALR